MSDPWSRRSLLAAAGVFVAGSAHGQPVDGRIKVEIRTQMGLIVLELRPDKAPITSANFLRYVDAKHFDGASFYRAAHPPGKQLEVLIPSDDIPTNGRPLPPVKCSLTVTLHNFVYLLLRDGKLLEISQEDYWKRPVLRDFLAGETPTIQPRPEPQFTVPAYPPH